MTGRRVLVLAPHADDESVGMGGTIAWHDQIGDHVFVQAFSDIMGIQDEFMAAIDVLGIDGAIMSYGAYLTRHFPEHRQDILQFLCDMDPPDIVYCPSSWDCHQDHQVVYQEAIRAFRTCTILGYEMPYNTILPSHPTCYTMLGRKHINLKMKAIRCYSSQPERRKMRWELLPDLAKLRGMQCGSQYAEAFEVIRWIR